MTPLQVIQDVRPCPAGDCPACESSDTTALERGATVLALDAKCHACGWYFTSASRRATLDALRVRP